MSAGRVSFNPCVHNNSIYICGGGESTVEVFDIRTAIYAMLSGFELPASQKFGCAAVVQGDLLCVYSWTHLSKWSLTTRKEVMSQPHEKFLGYSNCTPVVAGENLLIVSLGEMCIVAVSLETGAVTNSVEIRT